MNLINLNNVLIITKWFTLLNLGHLVINYQTYYKLCLTITWCFNFYSSSPYKKWWFIKIDKTGIIFDHT